MKVGDRVEVVKLTESDKFETTLNNGITGTINRMENKGTRHDLIRVELDEEVIIDGDERKYFWFFRYQLKIIEAAPC